MKKLSSSQNKLQGLNELKVIDLQLTFDHSR